MDPLRVDIMGLTYKVQSARIVHRIERESGMDRLAEKLARAGGVAKRVSDKIEARADALIARETEFDGKIDQSFAPHEDTLDANEKGLDQFENMLGQLTNFPLQSSTEPPPLPKPDAAFAGHPVMKNNHNGG